MDMLPLSQVIIRECVFLHCISSASESVGGSIAAVDASIRLKTSYFTGSKASYGAAIGVISHSSIAGELDMERLSYIDTYPNLTVEDGDFHSNEAAVSGGALYVVGGSVSVVNSKFGDIFNVHGPRRSRF